MSGNARDQGKGKGKGKRVSWDDVAPTSRLNMALDEIAEQRRAPPPPQPTAPLPRPNQGVRRRHVRNAALAPVKDADEARPPLESVRLSEVDKTYRRGHLAGMSLKDDRNASNFEVVCGRTTFATADNPGSLHRALGNAVERNVRSNNGEFREMSAVFFENKPSGRDFQRGETSVRDLKMRGSRPLPPASTSASTSTAPTHARTPHPSRPHVSGPSRARVPAPPRAPAPASSRRPANDVSRQERSAYHKKKRRERERRRNQGGTGYQSYRGDRRDRYVPSRQNDNPGEEEDYQEEAEAEAEAHAAALIYEEEDEYAAQPGYEDMDYEPHPSTVAANYLVPAPDKRQKTIQELDDEMAEYFAQGPDSASEPQPEA